MFQKGDLIVYGNMGVCRVEAVEAPAGLPGAGEKKLYYKLDPVYETGTVYIPVHDQIAFLKHRIPSCKTTPPVSSRTGDAPRRAPSPALRSAKNQNSVRF